MAIKTDLLILLTLAILCSLVIVLSACVPVQAPAPVTATPAAGDTAPAAMGTPAATDTPPPTATPPSAEIVVVDHLDREVILEEIPERVVSMAPSLTEMLFAVGAGEQVVGVTTYCNYPPEAQEREKIGGFSAKSINLETLVALDPDLVFAGGSIHQPIIDSLEELGIPVLALDPGTLEEVYESITMTGELTGHQAQASEVVKEMRAQVAEVTAVVNDIPEAERLKVYWQIWDEPLMTAGPSTFAGQMIELAGGINIFGDLSEDYPQISAETVVERNPDVIMGPDTHGDKLTMEAFEQRPGWDEIDAVHNERIHLIDGDMVSRAGPRLPQALEQVARSLYPERFE